MCFCNHQLEICFFFFPLIDNLSSLFCSTMPDCMTELVRAAIRATVEQVGLVKFAIGETRKNRIWTLPHCTPFWGMLMMHLPSMSGLLGLLGGMGHYQKILDPAWKREKLDLRSTNAHYFEFSNHRCWFKMSHCQHILTEMKDLFGELFKA